VLLHALRAAPGRLEAGRHVSVEGRGHLTRLCVWAAT
jgi:hypothetical protein